MKTHFPVLSKNPEPLIFKKAICIIRHPIDTFYSNLFIFRHEKQESPKRKQITKDLLLHYVYEWKKFYEFWSRQENVLIIRFEDLYDDPYQTLKTVLEIVGYHASNEDLQRAINKYSPRGGTLRYINDFSIDELALIKNELIDLLKQYGYEF